VHILFLKQTFEVNKPENKQNLRRSTVTYSKMKNDSSVRIQQINCKWIRIMIGYVFRNYGIMKHFKTKVQGIPSLIFYSFFAELKYF